MNRARGPRLAGIGLVLVVLIAAAVIGWSEIPGSRMSVSPSQTAAHQAGLPATGASPPLNAQGVAPGFAAATSTAVVGPIIFARGVSRDGKPIDASRQFPLGILQIYAIFEVRGLKGDDLIHEVLYWAADRPVDKRLTARELFGGPPKDGLYPLTLYRSVPWPAGSYRLELSLNGVVVQKGTFEVVPKAGLGPIVFARDAAADGTPIGAATQFPAGIGRIFAVFHGEGLKAGDVIGAVWFRGSDRVAAQKYSAADFFAPQQQHGWIVIYCGFSSGWTPGGYRLELSLRGAVVQTSTFEVRPQ